MPSFRSLATLAIMALSFAPAMAKGTNAHAIARDVHGANVARAVGSPTVVERSDAKSAAAKRALVRREASKKSRKAAAAKKAKAAKAKKAKAAAAAAAAAAAPAAVVAAATTPEESAVTSSSTSGSFDPYALNGAFAQGIVAAAAAARKCSRDKACASVELVANSYAICYQRRCALRCNSGFAPGGADGTQCVAQPTTCDGVNACPTVSGGFVGCNGTTCTQNCVSALGLSLFTDGTSFVCVALASDANNCGTVGNVCPISYNNVGTPICIRGGCSLRCTSGTYPYSTSSAAFPRLCA